VKKKNLSFMTLFMLTASLVAGCSCNKQSNENVSNLVIKVGDKEYSADELYNELLSTGTGANEAFNKILRLVVESSMDTSPNIQAAADLAAEAFEEEVKNDSLTNGTSKDESRKKLLEEKGYTSVEQMKSDIIYEQKLTRITEQYWEENKGNYFNSYLEARMPYLVRHVLVKIDDTNANKIANNVSISQTDAEKLFDVIKRFESGDKFSYVANQESEDTGSTATGGAYYMDNTYGVNGFVDEFVYGTYAFDAYTTRTEENDKVVYEYGADSKKVGKLAGLTDTETFAKYYKDGFNFVDMAHVNMLGEVYNQTTLSNKDYFNIGVVNKIEQEEGDPIYESASGNLNSSENAYARSIIFNRVFNKPGVSVVGYNDVTEIPEGVKNYVELKISDSESKYILTDEKGHPIFFVAARGSGNQIWVHFLTIDFSTLDSWANNDMESAKKFFGLTPDATDSITSYVELMNTAGTSQGANAIVAELESYVKSYATYGNGNAVGEESILKYDMVNHYMGTTITYVSEELESAINSYVTNRKAFLATKLSNALSDDWDTHTDKMASNMSDYVQKGIKPFECGVFVASDVSDSDNPYTALTTSDYLCRYVYGEGYQVQLSYYYQSGTSSDSFTKISKSNSNRAYFDDNAEDKYVQYVTIGGENSNHIILPTPAVANGYQFKGWYTDKAMTENHEVSKDLSGKYYIDLSESRMTNSTIFFAKIEAIAATTINYVYKYAGTDVTVGSEVSITDTNPTSRTFVTGGNNTITFDSSLVGGDVSAVGYKNSEGEAITDLTITSEDQQKTIDIIVEIEPKETKIDYVFVNSSGIEVEAANGYTGKGVIDVTNLKYSAATGANNNATPVVSDFEWGTTENPSTNVVTGFRVSREKTPEFNNDLDQTLTLTEGDINKTITIYVIVGGNV